MDEIDADVLVIGAGPAGSAAAIALARRGRRTVLVDRAAFPRDKVCGDALLPDALRALERLRLRDRVEAEAASLDALHVHAPDATRVELRAPLACVPRRRLDDLLRREAEAAGATFLAPWSLVSARMAGDAVAGAVLRNGGGSVLGVCARATILATGAAWQPLATFGVGERRAPSAVAARLVVEVPPDIASRHRALALSFDGRLRPGYGWVFPLPGAAFNVGVGCFRGAGRTDAGNLRVLFERFAATFPPAAELCAVAIRRTPLSGAPLRTALQGARFHRPGLLVAGEAAGTTYPFSGEGIGKAIESGIAAAEVLGDWLDERQPRPEDPGPRYAERLGAFAGRFDAYRRAQEWLARPALASFLARRANAGRHARAELQALLEETGDPRELFSFRGLAKAALH